MKPTKKRSKGTWKDKEHAAWVRYAKRHHRGTSYPEQVAASRAHEAGYRAAIRQQRGER